MHSMRCSFVLVDEFDGLKKMRNKDRTIKVVAKALVTFIYPGL